MNRPRVSLREVSSIITKGTTPKTLGLQYSTEGIPFLRGEDIRGTGVNPGSVSFHIDEETNSALRRSIILPGDVLMTIAGTVGRVGFVPRGAPAMNCNQAVAIVRIDSARVYPEFACLALQAPSVRNAVIAQGTTATITNLSLQQVGAFAIPLPSMVEQRRVVDLLSRTAGLKRLAEEAQAKARELIPALFVDMFGDPATNPKGWPTGALGDLADIQGGLQVTRARALYPLQLPYLRVANVYRDRLELSEIKFIGATERELGRVQLQPQDLLLVEGHGNPLEVGRAAIWDGSIPNCVHQNHLIRVRPHAHLLDSRFAAAFINSTSGRRELTKQGKTTSGLSTISTSNVKQTILFVPPIGAQRQFAARVEEVISVKRLAERSALVADRATAALMSRLFAV